MKLLKFNTTKMAKDCEISIPIDKVVAVEDLTKSTTEELEEKGKVRYMPPLN